MSVRLAMKRSRFRRQAERSETCENQQPELRPTWIFKLMENNTQSAKLTRVGVKEASNVNPTA